jgi:hypothetical protein
VWREQAAGLRRERLEEDVSREAGGLGDRAADRLADRARPMLGERAR